ncbi:hypothetical protein LIX87_08120 [Weissella viridescens]|uniref:hypothetical protein n=1 Tax=Weissella viridescens TaxID=1629 RepID=UPI001D07575C|nr:hypothetical protein [Weissella viridescens]MCB6840956.1 hypothetical protein [Weissella viridescens]MCB6847690.1 hypothetical protein [Weissella viridescens]
MTKDPLDKLILWCLWGIAIIVCLITVGINVVQNDKTIDSLKHKTTVQQNKIDKQQREISRLEQTNKALVNQAKGRY